MLWLVYIISWRGFSFLAGPQATQVNCYNYMQIFTLVTKAKAWIFSIYCTSQLIMLYWEDGLVPFNVFRTLERDCTCSVTCDSVTEYLILRGKKNLSWSVTTLSLDSITHLSFVFCRVLVSSVDMNEHIQSHKQKVIHGLYY